MKRSDALAWITDLQKMVDHKLVDWQKKDQIDDGEVMQFTWRWRQTRIILNVFWEDGKEIVYMQYASPRVSHEYRWSGLNNKSFNRVMDRVGNLAQVTMHPPIEPDC